MPLVCCYFFFSFIMYLLSRPVDGRARQCDQNSVLNTPYYTLLLLRAQNISIYRHWWRIQHGGVQYFFFLANPPGFSQIEAPYHGSVGETRPLALLSRGPVYNANVPYSVCQFAIILLPLFRLGMYIPFHHHKDNNKRGTYIEAIEIQMTSFISWPTVIDKIFHISSFRPSTFTDHFNMST